MTATNTKLDTRRQALQAALQGHWGFDTLRPLQGEAMDAALAGGDALVVMPTGGGKSLCYQAPALLHDRPTIVVSPLISLMKDQVDALLERNIPAAYLNSSLDAADRRRVWDGIGNGRYKLVFVAPERLTGDGFWNQLDRTGIAAFAIDEAHCISHWGHDFRAEYRQLGQLKQRFPEIPVHAFTATATPRVRDDIVKQLHLCEPAVLVGDFFRPNLHYSVAKRGRGFGDVIHAVRQRDGKAGIVYCIRRTDVDDLTVELNARGIPAQGYHAGLDDAQRASTQDDFAAGRTDVIVATVAFGMGIDRPDIRFVIHAAMPKSLEHYQQETGRAGRDGEPAECLLLYSGADFGLWKSIIEGNESTGREDHLNLLNEMYRYCAGMRCRHRCLATYFGQQWQQQSCGACDFCDGGIDALPDSTVTAQKILSCVARTGERFGAGHVTDVLLGSATDRVLQREHNELSTFGLLRGDSKPTVMAWVDQLVDQGLLHREGEYRVLTVTPAGWAVMRSQAEATLYDTERAKQPSRKTSNSRKTGRTAKTPKSSSPRLRVVTAPRPLNVDERDLFEHLKAVRRDVADELGVPAFMVFSDQTLREMARLQPGGELEMLEIKGVGPAKYRRFGERFVKEIREARYRSE